MAVCIVVSCLAFSSSAAAAEPTAEQVEFFERKIRPVLIERCYECHNSTENSEGDLALDSRDGVLQGGASGPAVVPGQPDESRLLRAIQHADDVLRMPEGDPKLSPEIVADFARWIEMGAPDPRDQPPTSEELAAATSWEAIRERRQQWWSFQPVSDPALPDVTNHDWSDHAVDRFILKRLKDAGLAPVEQADRRTLIRRLSFALTGLPPTVDEVDAFLADDSAGAYGSLVDRLLESQHFGERWARHWMDLFRYTESHGSEGDPGIPYVYRYRDYLIRALNADVPYDQLVREHIAGDLLPAPRIDVEGGLNESALGIGHFRMVEHGYAPIDALEERVRFTENQIDVISKAFLGLTVSCARCHDHKFDPISQQDYTAWYGIFSSCRPALITVDAPGRLDIHREELGELKDRVRAQLADAWLNDVDRLISELPDVGDEVTADWNAALQFAADAGATSPLHAWLVLREVDPSEFASRWDELRTQRDDVLEREHRLAETGYPRRWQGDDLAEWYSYGGGLAAGLATTGEFSLQPEGEQVVRTIQPAGIYTNLLSDKHNGVLSSPDFEIDFDTLWIRAAGGSGARVRFVVEDYPRVIGLLYKGQNLNAPTPTWVQLDVSYFKGDRAHLEFATAQDLPVESGGESRSWFGVTEVIGVQSDQPGPEETGRPLLALTDQAPSSIDALRESYGSVLRDAIESWRDGSMTDDQAQFLDVFVRNDLLPNTLERLPDLVSLIEGYRRLESEVPVPTRAPGLLETTGLDSPLFVRGDHRRPGDPVPRGFLEALDSEPYHVASSGRLELAEDLVRADNPLAARVIVNRVWHHLFGRGLVATPDNFGHLGAKPTHPQLLDYLVTWFASEDYSIKRLIRLLVTSQTFQLRTRPAPGVADLDPDNSLLSHMRVRRLEAEAIRDALLAVSGRLNRDMYGPSVGGNNPRRSVYVGIRRNSLDPFLATFDAPAPFSTVGRRDVTNVPAQSLALMNDPFVIDLARQWGEDIANDGALQTEQGRVERLFEQGLGRPPSAAELTQTSRFLSAAAERRDEIGNELERLQSESQAITARIAEILDPVRAQLIAARQERGEEVADLTAPIARWDFDGDLRDSIGELHGEAIDNARVEDGRLILDGQSFVRTALIPADIREKTLEVWVTLSNLDQRAGGAITIQTPDGVFFDSIVYAERESRHWMSGSNNFSRTQDAGGTDETDEILERPVHIAITYSGDGTITCYRDGERYGRPYKSSGPFEFKAGNAQILFGMRHGTPGGRTAQLGGAIDRAQLYDRALSVDEIAASARGVEFVTRRELLAALSQDQRDEIETLETVRDALSESLTESAMDMPPGGPNAHWHDLAQAIFNFKEFIYIK